MYDVIIVGARVAGSATALLLARKGVKVLVVERATFPSDTLSTHNIQLPGVARLKRWGLLDRIIAAGTPAARHVIFDPGPVVLEGHFPSFEGIDALYSPRRTVLDKILVDAARQAGAEVRENFMVEDLVQEAGRVGGIRGREKGGAALTETADLVVGADGKQSLVARTVGAAAYHQKPALSLAFYTYWDGVPLQGGEMYGRERRFIGAWPTNDGLVMTYVAWPIAEYHGFRADVESAFLSTLDLAGDLGQRARNGRRVGPIRGTIDLPNYFRTPYGPGWALVGDAGLVMDPVTGQGIGDAFRDAELLAEAIEAGLGGRQPLDAALAGYQERRDRAALPMYEFTTALASFGPPKPEERILMAALRGKPAEISRFLGVLTGAVPMQEYFTPRNLGKIIGVRGMARMMLGKMRPARPKLPRPVEVAAR